MWLIVAVVGGGCVWLPGLCGGGSSGGGSGGGGGGGDGEAGPIVSLLTYLFLAYYSLSCLLVVLRFSFLLTFSFLSTCIYLFLVILAYTYISSFLSFSLSLVCILLAFS